MASARNVLHLPKDPFLYIDVCSGATWFKFNPINKLIIARGKFEDVVGSPYYSVPEVLLKKLWSRSRYMECRCDPIHSSLWGTSILGRIINNVEKKLMSVLEFMSERGSVTDLQSIFQRLTFDGTMSLLLDIDPETLTVDLPHSKFAVAFTQVGRDPCSIDIL
ncbi:cytochrome P450 [Artemisia annua]|uniref:Cytochrome P450 n=1 Tax=Artemisia annua TaxID=35608 RepID=A0A2U1MCT2_ARTAN|nr:cytochrome P450 [Artemisia annua]